jgi:4-diphosphocytidyl-2C-methyl-D-erythritol kinase
MYFSILFSSTKDVFALHPTSSPEAKIHELITVYQTGNVNDIGSKLFNDLIVPASMIATSNHHQSPLWYQEMLLSHEAVAASMSGSGSTVLDFMKIRQQQNAFASNFRLNIPTLKFGLPRPYRKICYYKRLHFLIKLLNMHFKHVIM